MRFGRSIRENAERGIWRHMVDAFQLILGAHRWPWDDLWQGILAIANFALFPLTAITFPVMVPLAGILRHRYAKRQLAQYPAYVKKSDDLHK